MGACVVGHSYSSPVEHPNLPTDITGISWSPAIRPTSSRCYTGIKYQCVELARRWLVVNKRVTFDDVTVAHTMFDSLPHARSIMDANRLLPFECIANGSAATNSRPALGDLLIWHEGGFYPGTGHVAVVTESSENYVRIAEQNFDDCYWPANQHWSRQLPVEVIFSLV
jgi:glutathionylspermidine amidase/synthetase